MDALLADNEVFHSPVVHSPQKGKVITKLYLGAAMSVLNNESFRYLREVVGEADAVLEFATEIDGMHARDVVQHVTAWIEADARVILAAMAEPARARDVYAELAALPDHMVGEVIHGQLYAQARPALRHAQASSALGGELGPPFRNGRGGPGGWIILDEPELHLGERPDILVPDLAGWRRERVPELPDAAYFDLAPDWACEVLSPATQRLDRTHKRDIYLRERVKHLWFVDPDARTLEIFRFANDAYLLAGTFAEDARVRAEPFDAIELELGLLWAR